ncbi:hypothetical protein [Rhodococcus koreensis]
MQHTPPPTSRTQHWRTAGSIATRTRPHTTSAERSDTFAVATLVRWYRSGEDVGALLPRLSTYLGHLTPTYTYWYLSAAPELLDLAAARLEKARGTNR